MLLFSQTRITPILTSLIWTFGQKNGIIVTCRVIKPVIDTLDLFDRLWTLFLFLLKLQMPQIYPPAKYKHYLSILARDL